jgi:hypothetical protein
MLETFILSAVVAGVVAAVVARKTQRRSVIAPQVGGQLVMAKKVVVIDDAGIPRLVLACDDHGPVLELYGSDGKERVILGVNKLNDAVLALFDPQGRERARMAAEGTDSETSMTLFDAKHAPHALLSVMDPKQTGEPVTMLQLRSEEGGIALNSVAGLSSMAFQRGGTDAVLAGRSLLLSVMATPTAVTVTDEDQRVIWQSGV